MKVTFIGLGKMGLPMARNIAQAGHDVTVWNRTSERAQALSTLGVRVAEDLAASTRGAEIVCLCLTTPDVVESVVLGESGALAGAEPGSVWIDFSTIDMMTSQKVASRCGEQGVHFIDAPVSGGPEGAEAGTLTVMVGGEETLVEMAIPVLEAIGQRIIPVGPQGSALGIKLLNQLLVGANLASVFETFVLATKAGIDLETMYDVISESAGSSFMFTRNVKDFLISESYEPGFALRLLVKDLDLVSEMGRTFDTPLLMSNVALQLFRRAIQAGYGEKDMAAGVIPMLTDQKQAENKQGKG